MTTLTRATDPLRIAHLSGEELTALLDLAGQQAANRLPTEQAALYALVTDEWEV